MLLLVRREGAMAAMEGRDLHRRGGGDRECSGRSWKSWIVTAIGRVVMGWTGCMRSRLHRLDVHLGGCCIP